MMQTATRTLRNPVGRRFGWLTAIVAIMVLGSQPVSACGATTDCRLGERTYRIKLPDGYDGTKPVGALVFMHGWRSNPASAMENAELVAFANAQGLALVAPKSSQEGWDIAGSPSERGQVELPFFDELIAALPTRHNMDPANLIATGFSAGGMMVWNLICFRSTKFRAFVPVAGTYWTPLPQTCPVAEANVIHIHGTSDEVVPMVGRVIGEFRQGDVRMAFERYRAQSKYSEELRVAKDGLECAIRVGAASNHIALCLHNGGHSYSVAHLALAFDMFGPVKQP